MKSASQRGPDEGASRPNGGGRDDLLSAIKSHGGLAGLKKPSERKIPQIVPKVVAEEIDPIREMQEKLKAIEMKLNPESDTSDSDSEEEWAEDW